MKAVLDNGLVIEMEDTIDNLEKLAALKVNQEPQKDVADQKCGVADDAADDEADDEACLDIECDDEPCDITEYHCDPNDEPVKKGHDREDAVGLLKIFGSVFGGKDFRVFHGRLSKGDCCSSTFVMDVKKDMYCILNGSEIPRHDPESTVKTRLNDKQVSEREKYIQTNCVSVQRQNGSKQRKVYVVGLNEQWLTYQELRNILQDTTDTVTAYYDVISQESLNVVRRNSGLTKCKSTNGIYDYGCCLL